MKQISVFFAVTLVTTLLLVTACNDNQSSSAIEISEAWVRVVPMQMDTTPGASDAVTGTQMSHAASGGLGAAYMTLSNNSDTADQLLKASSEIAHVVELHTVEEKDGMMSMRPVEFVEIPANGAQELKPGSFHIMLIGVQGEVKPGEKVKITLTFAQAGEVTVEAEVREE